MKTRLACKNQDGCSSSLGLPPDPILPLHCLEKAMSKFSPATLLGDDLWMTSESELVVHATRAYAA